MIGYCRSNLTEVKVGVPQDGVLGPVLFFLYMNDLPALSKKPRVTLYFILREYNLRILDVNV